MKEVDLRTLERHCGVSTNGIYLHWSPSQPDYVKIGESAKSNERCVSSDYFTAFGQISQFRIWYATTNIDHLRIQNECMIYLDTLYNKGTAGVEVYYIGDDSYENVVTVLHNHIMKTYPSLEYYIDTDVTQLKSINKSGLCTTDISCLVLVKYEYISNLSLSQKCYRCNRACSKRIYDVVCMDKDEEKNILLGPGCFKYLNKNMDIAYNKLYETLTKMDDADFDDINLHHVVDVFLQKFQYDRRVKYGININKLSEIPYKCIGPYIISCICHYMFCKKVENSVGSFTRTINKDFLNIYNIDIHLGHVHHYTTLAENYFKLSDYDDYGQEFFNVTFTHPTINTKWIIENIENIKNTIKYKKDGSISIDQLEILNNPNPIKLGEAGTGKSRVAQFLCKNSNERRSKICVITPTHSSRINICSDLYSNYLTSHVIAGFNSHVTKYDMDDEITIIIDEIGMLDIFNWHKILQFVHKFKRRHVYMFGDLYQTPPINFQDETKPIRNATLESSISFVENFRYSNNLLNEDLVNYIRSHKCSFTMKGIEKVGYTIDEYTTPVLRELNDNNYVFITTTNQTKNLINNHLYQIHNKKCKECVADIIINDNTYCNKCIENYNFIVKSNLFYNKPDRISKCHVNITEDIPNSMNDIYQDQNGKCINIKRPFVTNSDKLLFFNSEHVKIIKEKDHYVLVNIVDDKYVNYRRIKTLDSIKLDLTFAQTTHSAQGQTMDNIAFVLDRYYIDTDIAYTAITRTRFLDTMVLLRTERFKRFKKVVH